MCDGIQCQQIRTNKYLQFQVETLTHELSVWVLGDWSVIISISFVDCISIISPYFQTMMWVNFMKAAWKYKTNIMHLLLFIVSYYSPNFFTLSLWIISGSCPLASCMDTNPCLTTIHSHFTQLVMQSFHNQWCHSKIFSNTTEKYFRCRHNWYCYWSLQIGFQVNRNFTRFHLTWLASLGFLSYVIRPEPVPGQWRMFTTLEH